MSYRSTQYILYQEKKEGVTACSADSARQNSRNARYEPVVIGDI